MEKKENQKGLFEDLLGSVPVKTENTLNISIDTNVLIKIALTIIFVSLFLLVIKKVIQK